MRQGCFAKPVMTSLQRFALGRRFRCLVALMAQTHQFLAANDKSNLTLDALSKRKTNNAF